MTAHSRPSTLLRTLVGPEAAFRPGQAEAIAALLKGQSVLTVMPTGAGKSLIYQVAGMLRPGLAIVISPLIALMKDQVDGLRSAGLPAAFVNSALAGAEQRAILADVARRQIKLLYVAPERLRHRLFRRALGDQPIGLLAVDEAHCLSQWGHDFRPDYLHIAAFRQEIGAPPTAALTATATPRVQDDIVRLLGLLSAERIVAGFNRRNLTFKVRYTPSAEDKLWVLADLLVPTARSDSPLRRATPGAAGDVLPIIPGVGRGSAIIYTGTRREAEEVAAFVREVCCLRAQHYHAGLEAQMRSRVQEAFMTGRVPVIVATNAFGMGVDKPDVRLVAHFNLPGTVDAYYQEAGRAGRDGSRALCALLYAPEDRALQEWFISKGAPSLQELRAVHRAVGLLVHHGSAAITMDELSVTTGIAEVPLRVAIGQLESAGALRRLSTEGSRLWLEAGRLDPERLQMTMAEAAARRAHKKRELECMIAYAETDACRRRLILDHFGDPGPAEALECCDNCLAAAAARPAVPPADTVTVEALPSDARVPLAILDTVHCMRWNVGQRTLARILKGSRAKEIIGQRYDRLVYYGRLADMTIGEIREIVGQLVAQGYLKVVGGSYPVVRLTPRGQQALDQEMVIHLKLSPRHSTKLGRRRRQEQVVGGTVACTERLLSQGLSPAQIAASRGLTMRTIYRHLASLIAGGTVSVDTVVPRETQEQVLAAMSQAGEGARLSAVKLLLPEAISYGMIRCVRAARPNQQRAGIAGPGSTGLSIEEKTILECVSTAQGQLPRSGIARLLVGSRSKRLEAFRLHPMLGRLAGYGRDEVLVSVDRLLGMALLAKDEHGHIILTRDGQASLLAMTTSAESDPLPRDSPLLPSGSALPGDSHEPASRIAVLGNTESDRHVPTLAPVLAIPGADAVEAFLSRSHPRRLLGPWKEGWALDAHSRFSGTQWSRTEVGELAYRCKYGGEQVLVEPLADRLASLVRAHCNLASADGILPVPSTEVRAFDTVWELAKALGRRFARPVPVHALIKTRQTLKQKGLHTLAQKKANVSGAFTLRGDVVGQRLLVVDDLYDSGATLAEVTGVLMAAGAVSVCVLTVSCTIHSEG